MKEQEDHSRLTYLLLDFENLQPSPQEIALVRDDHLRLWVFHGPHQNKFAAEMVKAWQPLGERVEFVQSSKTGKNALDFHIAFTLGRLHQRHQANGDVATYVIVSRDAGFEALFEHVAELGGTVRSASSISNALASTMPVVVPPQPTVIVPRTAELKAPAADAASLKVKAAKPATKPRAVVEPADIEKAIANLRAHPRNRPSDREALERHVTSLMGKKVSAAVSRAVVSDLEKRQVVTFAGKKAAYKFPKRKAASA